MKWVCKSFIFLLFIFVVNVNYLLAIPTRTSYHIKVDQFGYLPTNRKVAVIADPQIGYNSSESFTPGIGTNQYQVRRWNDDVVVFSGTLQVWNSGATHAQSGDRGWWFDFSALTTTGSYYIFDIANNVGSFRFDIEGNVYDEVLKQAMRTFFYQRLNFAKQVPYTDAKWADGASYEGPSQDRFATSRFAKGDKATARDLHGGWMDAGDVNKYTTFAHTPVVQLMEAFRMNPAVFADNYIIPESGNGIPDVLDEVKWELDFLKRMQDATATNGFLLKVGVDHYNEVTPISADTRPRYYLPECTSSTIAGCSMFAVSGVTLKNVPALSAYGIDLINRAELAWARAKVTTNNFTSWQTACDDGDIKSGDADNSAEEQFDNVFVAAVYLFEATGKVEYKNFAEANYTKVNPYKNNWWGPYFMPQHLALLRLTTLPGVSSTVVNNIRNQKANMDYQNSLSAYNAGTDLYRAHMNDDAYHWGHNQVRANAGNMNLDFIAFNVNSTRSTQYKEVAAQYIHWMHGVNPMGMVMLSNMYGYGAEKCANEIFHTWFKNSSSWDNAQTSPNGPAPGYVPGGPNKQYSGPVSGISTQPHQKAYKDWNTDYPENSWEVTEPAIYYQASYVMLLARLMPLNTTPAPTPDTEAPTAPTNLVASNITANSLTLSWTASTDHLGVTGYDVYRGASLVQANITNTTLNVTGLVCATTYSFTVKAKDAAGNISAVSNSCMALTNACAVISTKNIYSDILEEDWQDISTASTRNFSNTNPVKTGIKSIKVDYQGNGTLILGNNTAVATTANTQLRFWVYNTSSKNGITVYTESTSGIKSSILSLKPARSKWVEVLVSMSQLGNPASIQKVIIQNSGSAAATMYFDEIQLTAVTDIIPSGARFEVQADKEQLSDIDWNVYPNPAKEYIIVNMQIEKPSKALLRIFNMAGRVVYEQATQLKEGLNQWQINLPELQSGKYHVSIITEDSAYTKGLLVL
jgi:hypothetical protein